MTTTVHKATAAPSAPAVVHATPTPTASHAASPAAPALVAAGANAVALVGTVNIDAGYVARVKAGSVLAAGDGTLLATGVVSNNGGSAISLDRATMQDAAGATIVVPGEANVIADPAAAGVVANNGGSVVANNGGSRRLLAADADPARLAPAAGMVVVVRSLATGQLLPVGQDAAGKPVYGVYSNWRGGYKLYLPAGTDGNVQVEAKVPHQADARLKYEALGKAAAGTLAVDEETSSLASMVRIVTKRFVLLLEGTDADQVFLALHFDRSAGTQLVRPTLEAFAAAAREGQLDKLSPAQRDALADSLTDQVLARVDLGACVPAKDLSPVTNPMPQPAPDCLGIIAVSTKRRRESLAAVFAKLQAEGQDPAEVISAGEIVKAASARDKTTYRIERPSDVADFTLRGIVLAHFQDTAAVSADVTAFDHQAGIETPPGAQDWNNAAYEGLQDLVGATVFGNEELIDQFVTRFKSSKP